MDKKLLTIVTIVLSLVFIMALVLIFSNISTLTRNTNNDIANMNETLMRSEFEPYENKIVSGDTVIATINKFRETREGYKLSYAVCYDKSYTGSSSFWSYYGMRRIQYASGNIGEHLYNNIMFSGDTSTRSYSIAVTGTSTEQDTGTYYTYSGTAIKPTDKYLAKVAYIRNMPIGITFVKQ